MSRAVRFAPLAVFVLLVVSLIWRLSTPIDTNVRSKLEGQAVPSFPPVAAAQGVMAFGSDDLADGQPHLVNFFASWCVPCISEVKVLQDLKTRGAPIYGIAVRDEMEDADVFLTQYGNPYALITADPQSKIQIAFGSSGVPETFVVDGRGIIRYQHIGPIGEKEIPLILSKLEQAK